MGSSIVFVNYGDAGAAGSIPPAPFPRKGAGGAFFIIVDFLRVNRAQKIHLRGVQGISRLWLSLRVVNSAGAGGE